jgi:hypothetical protein
MEEFAMMNIYQMTEAHLSKSKSKTNGGGGEKSV